MTAESGATASPHTDVYGLGAVLYTLLTRQPPVTAANAVDIFAAIVSSQPATSLDRLRRQIPPVLTRICMRCLAKHPNERLAHAGALARALREFVVFT
jgi:serine/threonine protein kinase